MYVPLNAHVFLAALTGAMAGLAGGTRTPTDATSTDDSNTAAVAGAFAQSFDTAWGATEPNAVQEATIRTICEATWSGRGQPPNGQGITPSGYTPWCQGLIAEVQALSTWFSTNVGTPPVGCNCNGDPVALGDADQTITYAQGGFRTVATRSAARAYRLANTGVPKGAQIDIAVADQAAHTVSFFDDTSGAMLLTIANGNLGSLLAQAVDAGGGLTKWIMRQAGQSNGVAP